MNRAQTSDERDSVLAVATETPVGARTASVSMALLLLTAAFMLAKTGRDALYFQAGGIYDLPKGYLGVALLSIPAAGVMLGLMRLFGTRLARVAAILGTAACLVLVAWV